MCRHLAYLGPPIPLAELLFTPAHGLVHQSWAPRDMRGGGTINADGFGVGWYQLAADQAAHPIDADQAAHPIDADQAMPVRYRRATPIWSDPDLRRLTEVTRAEAVVAAVRSATVGMPVSVEAAAPFSDGRWLFSHNGYIAGWPASVAPLAERLPVNDLLTLPAPTDSALLWALVRHRLRDGEDPRSAISATIADVAASAPASRLNVLFSDGTQIIATTFGHSLSVRSGSGRVHVCSEPLDDGPDWTAVPDHSLVIATAEGAAISPLSAPDVVSPADAVYEMRMP